MAELSTSEKESTLPGPNSVNRLRKANSCDDESTPRNYERGSPVPHQLHTEYASR